MRFVKERNRRKLIFYGLEEDDIRHTSRRTLMSAVRHSTRKKNTETIHSEGEGTDNFTLALAEWSYFMTRDPRRYHRFSGTCSGGEIGHLSSSPHRHHRRTDFPFAEGFLEHNSGACIHLPERPRSVHRSGRHRS